MAYKDKPGYIEGSWDDYTMAELGQFVHLLSKRANHRSDPEKRAKDIADACNYWRMMGAKLDSLAGVE